MPGHRSHGGLRHDHGQRSHARPGSASRRPHEPARPQDAHAALAEAEARIAQRHAELDKRIDQVDFQVQEAYEQVLESMQSVDLYEKQILPAAQANVEGAPVRLRHGPHPFPRAWWNRDAAWLAGATATTRPSPSYFRRLATLERVVGGPIAAK